MIGITGAGNTESPVAHDRTNSDSTSGRGGDPLPHDTWGDSLSALDDETKVVRVLSLNVGGIPPKLDSPKLKLIKNIITDTQADICALSEINTNWNRIPADRKLPELLFGWKEMQPRISSGFLADSPSPGHHNYGGTSVWAFHTAKDRSAQYGSDNRGLGRWSWLRFQGKQGIFLRVVSCYRPNFNPREPGSAWSQQKTTLNAQGSDAEPRALFMEDLAAETKEWLNQGDQVIIGGDFNEDISNRIFQLTLGRLGLVEICSRRHGRPPATSDTGSVPIDGLFVSKTLRHCRCGYLDFGEFNHRPLWIDIPHEIAYGYDLSNPAPSKITRLNLQDPRCVKRYQNILREEMEKKNLFQRVTRLRLTVNGTMTPRQQICYEGINLDHLECVNYAASHCRKIRAGAVEYSPDYSVIVYGIRYWKLVRKKLWGRKVCRRYMRRTAKKAGITDDPPSWSMPKVRTELRSLYNRNAAMKRNAGKLAKERRRDHREKLALAKEAAGRFSAAHYLRESTLHEISRTNNRLIRRCNGKMKNGSIVMVEGPVFDTNGNATDATWIPYTAKADIERACAWENSRRFTQSNGTPPMQAPIRSLLGPYGTSPFAQQILDGTFQAPDGTDPWLVKLFQQLQYHPEVQAGAQIDRTFSAEKLSKAWSAARASTAPGPSGYTIPQFKAHCLPGAEDLLDFDHVMMSIPYETGYSPRIWQHGINCMLEKKKGNFRVDKLRTILLYEVAFNQLNKILGRDMMHLAEDMDAIAIEQYGSRKNLSAVNHALNKGLTMDISRQLKMPIAICSNDAKSCYDRINHAVASLSMQRVGVPKEPIICMFTTIQELEHTIRTAYGTSSTSFNSKLFVCPFQGVGQGNGSGPAQWVVISTPVLNILRSLGFGAVFEAVISGESIHFVGYSFVDDTDLLCACKIDSSYEEVAEKMQQTVLAWEGGIRATGGALVPDKSFWYMIDYEWKSGRWTYKKFPGPPETSPTIQFPDTDGKLTTLRRLSADEAEKTLGVFLAPDMNNKAQVEYLRGKADNWAELVRTGHLPRHLAWQSLTTTIMKTLEYPLPALTLTKEECRKILAPVKAAGLSASGIVRTMSNALAHGPKAALGLGLTDLYTTQGVEHISRIVGLTHCKKDITGTLYKQSYEILTVELGLPGRPFDHCYQKWGSIPTNCRLVALWKFIAEHTISLELPSAQLVLRRENDHFLMDLWQGYPLRDRQALNRCRLYKKFVTLADITCGDGITMDSHSLLLSRDEDNWAGTRYRWPNQGKPSTTDWQTWQQAIRGLFGRDGKLSHPLGPWLSRRVAPSRWMYSPSTDSLYDTKEGLGVRFRKLPGRSTRGTVALYTPTNEQVYSALPADCIPATAQPRRSLWRFTGAFGFRSTVEDDISVGPTHFQQFLESQPGSARWALLRLDLAGLDGLVDCIRQDSARIVGISDGSFKDGWGTAHWIIRPRRQPDKEVSGYCFIPGDPEDQSAYRAELGGLYGMILFLQLLCEFYDLPLPRVYLGCDGDSAVDQMDKPSLRINPHENHFDLIGAGRRLLSELPDRPEFIYVDGHADAKKKWDELTEPEQMNCICDRKAKELLQEFQQTQPPRHYTVWKEPASVWLHGKKLCKSVRDSVIWASAGKKVQEYWQNQAKFPAQSQPDWDSIGRASKLISSTRQHWIVKHASGRAGFGVELCRRRHWNHAQCPRCTEPFETSEHCIRCPEAADQWQTSLATLRRWLITTTSVDISLAITRHLSAWHDGSPKPRFQGRQRLDPSVARAVSQQDLFGWHSFLDGFLALEWKGAHTLYLARTGSRASPERWCSTLIKKLWDISWDLWEHRNGILHDVDQGRLSRSTKRQLQQLYADGPAGTDRQCKPFFDEPLATHLSASLSKQIAWVRRIQSAKELSACHLHQERRQPQLQRALMHRYFAVTAG